MLGSVWGLGWVALMLSQFLLSEPSHYFILNDSNEYLSALLLNEMSARHLHWKCKDFRWKLKATPILLSLSSSLSSPPPPSLPLFLPLPHPTLFVFPSLPPPPPPYLSLSLSLPCDHRDFLGTKCQVTDQLFQWEVGDFIISDNLAVGHEATPETQRPVSEVGLRVLHRTTVQGKWKPLKEPES